MKRLFFSAVAFCLLAMGDAMACTNFIVGKNAFYGTYGRSAEFQYFHISMQFILPTVPLNNRGLLHWRDKSTNK